ncbi:MAG TPA: DUF4390 domain-containing protein [Burkholderiaceae bacterium]|nr:DUF4390 domain-containing protein [Burkholderiaceae bacterium]
MLNRTLRPAPAGPGAAERRLWLAALGAAALALLLPQRAGAQDTVSVESAELEVRDDPEPGLYLSAQFAFEPSPAIEDAVRRGIPVYFAIDFELVRRRWYWFNRLVVSATLGYRLTYSPLTRQFRLSRGALAQPFDTLDEALATVRTVRDWKVAGREAAASREHLLARIRLRLDKTMLPKPFQVDSLTNPDWALASDWKPVAIGPISQR